jgi:hypothetical protein
MSKYHPLTEHLRAQRTNQVWMSFAEIERVIGRNLPLSAASHRAWWSNNASNNVMTKAWLDAGFKSEQVDVPGRRLAFRRVSDPIVPPSDPSLSKPPDSGHSPKLGLFGWLRGTVSVAPGTELTDPADPEWAQRVEHDH